VNPSPSPELPPDPSPYEAQLVWRPWRKFRHRYWLHGVLFLLTLVTTTLTGAGMYLGFLLSAGQIDRVGLSSVHLANGLWYAIPVLVILGAHEFGHYVLCRIHDVDATLPFFIPAPPFLFLAGTFGAVIRIRETFPSKKALFDIGIAGPIAGFLVLVPLLYWGVTMSAVGPIKHSSDMVYLGEPLLYKAAAWLHFGRIPEGYDVMLHPMAMAAWWGMLATALNLMPFGQLDGGHVTYSLFGSRAVRVSIATLLAAALLTTRSISWVSMMVMMIVMAIVFGLRHPRVVDEDTPLDPGRRLIAWFALIMFVLCFTPVPIQTFFSK
jgi:membrane-associated protease RseP (regulator of RpoE activity)